MTFMNEKARADRTKAQVSGARLRRPAPPHHIASHHITSLRETPQQSSEVTRALEYPNWKCGRSLNHIFHILFIYLFSLYFI